MVYGRAVAVTASGHYASARSLPADVTLATPFNGYEMFSLSGSSEDSLRDLKTIFRLALPDETNFEAEVTLKSTTESPLSSTAICSAAYLTKQLKHAQLSLKQNTSQ